MCTLSLPRYLISASDKGPGRRGVGMIHDLMLLKACRGHKLPRTKSTGELGFHPLRRLWNRWRTCRELLPVLPVGQG